jgi:hypothetical protein
MMLAYQCSSPGTEIRQSVPKDVRDLDEKLGLYLFTESKTVGKKEQP